ncbi:Hypothetical protein CINCED_3A025516 [Cinara cedri]|uniref:Uncharacterized protein n=1 Tax=Cinara cedri TaxID=506608 RepID=A0A5E4N3Q7_9HEMI|nr:Hypothetical protein CINCED_3A025516 [Cinara cedri]
MTFPSTVKKSGSMKATSKTGSESKVLPPGSPGSPKLISVNTSAKLLPIGSSVKTPLANKVSEKVNDGSAVKNLSSKSITKPVNDVKFELAKKPMTKPPPLKLNTKSIDSKELQSPVTLKRIPKTPTTPSVKSFVLAKSPMVTKSSSTMSTSVSPGIVKSSTSPTSKSSQVTAGSKSSTTSSVKSPSTLKSSPVTKSPQVFASSKSTVISSPIAKSPSTLPTSKTLTVPKSPLSTKSLTPTVKSPLSTKSLTPSVKSIISKTTIKDNPTSLKSVSTKDQTTVVKSLTPTKNTALLSTNSTAGVKSPTTLTTKSSTISRSPSMTSSKKSISLKVPLSPSKSLTKHPNTTKVSPSVKLTVSNKPSIVSKPEPMSPKVMVKKESSTLSLLSVKSTSTTKSTSSIVSKTLVSKSPIVKTQSSVVKSPASPKLKTISLPIVKTPLSPIVKTKTTPSPTVKTKTPPSPTVKTKTPPSPIVKTRTTSISTAKPPLSPVIKKMVPTKLILSPGLTKSGPLLSSKLNSVSTDSLVSKTSLKSPKSPTKVVSKKDSIDIKNAVEPKSKGIRGKQPITKTIDIPGISELPSNLVSNKLETQDIEFKLENPTENILKEETEMKIIQILDQDSQYSEELEKHSTLINIDNSLTIANSLVNEETTLLDITNSSINQSQKVQEHNLETIQEYLIEPSTSLEEIRQDEEICCSSEIEIVRKDKCVPCLSTISQSVNNIDDNHFDMTNGYVIIEDLNKTQLCTVDIDDHFEPMNDKLVLGDVPFETDSSDISDSENVVNEIISTQMDDDVFSTEDNLPLLNKDNLSYHDFDRADSTELFIHKLLPKSMTLSEGESSVSTDDGHLSRKSYSEVVSGSPKFNDCYFDYDFEVADDCLDYDNDERSVFVEVTEKEFPELKSDSRKRNKKQKKRNYSNRTDSQSDSNISTSEINYNPEEFDGNEFCRYIKMMKDCSFYPNGLFSSDSVKLSTSSSLSWLDISIRTTDDDLKPSTEFLSTYEVFQGSYLNKDFLTSIIGSTTTPTNETTWFWKSIEGKHQMHNKANITLSLKPRPKHLTTPRFMTLLALISEAKGYEIKPSLSEHFVTTDCSARFDNKIRRLMVQGFWLVGRLIRESLHVEEEVNCGNPFEFDDGDIGLWWAGINMLDWQEYIKESGKNQPILSCYQFVLENMNTDLGNRYNYKEALLSMNSTIPDDFMSELDMDNFILTVRNVKYYCGNIFVDSQENIEVPEESCDDDGNLKEWDNNTVEKN